VITVADDDDPDPPELPPLEELPHADRTSTPVTSVAISEVLIFVFLGFTR
jgi:hypothetical protein